jgi:hypothetical protein
MSGAGSTIAQDPYQNVTKGPVDQDAIVHQMERRVLNLLANHQVVSAA